MIYAPTKVYLWYNEELKQYSFSYPCQELLVVKVAQWTRRKKLTYCPSAFINMNENRIENELDEIYNANSKQPTN